MGSVRGFAMGVGLGLALCMPAAAQFSDSFSFLRAVRDRDGAKAMPLINKPGAPVLNTRDPNTGETALHIVVKAHDMTWLAFLLSRDANTEIKDRDGNTPLAVAAQTGDADSARLLLQQGAKVDPLNSNGETPLILAAHQRDLPMVRVLVGAGADPKIRDTIAGKSARDYAGEDRRGDAMAKVMDEAKSTKPSATISGPVRQ